MASHSTEDRHASNPHGWWSRWFGRRPAHDEPVAAAVEPRRRMVFERLEDRQLMSADLVAALLPDPAHIGSLAPEPAINVEDQAIAGPATTGTSAVNAEQNKSVEILFVDTRVPDHEKLVADALAQNDGTHTFEVVLLDPDADGVQQISEALMGRRDVDAIHVVAHGSEGGLQLGATWLSSANISEHADELASWRDHLSGNADLLLYGCDVAAGTAGADFLQSLARITGADVSASIDATGHASLGGNWTLEVSTGAVEAPILFDAELQDSWMFTLGTATSGSESRLNTTTANNQNEAAVAMDASGNYVTVWTADGDQDGDKKGVYAQRYNASGVAQGAEFRVNTTTTGDQKAAAVAIDSNGNFVVTWTSSTQDPDGSAGIYAQRFNASGVAQGGEFRVNVTTSGGQDQSQVAMDASGNFVVAWKDASGSDSDVYARRYNSAGTALSSEFRVNTTTADDQDKPTIGMNASGAFVVAWKTSGGGGVFAQRYDASGVAQGGELQVNTTASSSLDKPTAAMTTNGDFVIAWVSGGDQDGDKNGIFAQRFNAAGTKQGGEFQVNTYTTDSQDVPTIAIDTAGNFTIAWSSKVQDPGNTKGVYAKSYDATGAVITEEFRVNTTTAGDQDAPAIAMRASTGDLVVVWQGEGTGDTSGVFAQRYQSLNVAPVNTVPGTQTSSGLGLVFSTAMGNAISVSDVDAGSGTLQVMLTATNGTLTLSGSAGLTFSAGDGTADATMTFTGTAAAINTSLNGLRFTPTPFFSGAASVQIVTNDLGHTGQGGALTDTDTVTVNVLAAATPYVMTGSFTGNAVDNRAIIGLGFTPDFVIIKARDDADLAAMRSSTMVGDVSKEMTGATAFAANEIQSLDADGFTLGTDASINKNGKTYDWIAFKASSSFLKVGTYAGNGGASASVSGLGFSPEAVFVFDASNQEAVFTNAAAGGSYNFDNNAGSYISSLDADGFTVGTDDRVNKSGHTYHYIAWNEIQGLMDVGSYTGSGADNRNITGVGFQAEYLLVRSAAGDSAVQHFDSQGAGTDSSSLFKGSTAVTNRIQALQADGFQVGSDDDVNHSGRNYSYIAWKQETGPTISAIADQTTPEDTPKGPIAFTIGDLETAAGSLSVTAVSSNQGILADASISFGGSGANRTLTLTPVANASGTTTITVYVTDGAAQSSVSFTLTVTAVNDAPVLDTTKSPALTAQNEDSGAPSGAVGTLVSSLVDFAAPGGQVDNVTDVDSGAALGIAVTAADATNGTWYYSTNGGTNWNALGAVATDNARLLATDASTRLYFQPNADWNGTLASAITFRAWDQTSGSNGALADTTTNGGTTAFSAATDTASLIVTAVNDAPVITSNGAGASASVSIAENTTAVTTVTATDVDLPAQTLSYSITGGADQAKFSINATTGALTFATPPNFESPTDANGDNVYLVTVQVSDGAGGTDTQAISVTVTDANDAPVITSNGAGATANVSVAENTAAVTTVTATDADQPAQTLSYSITGGADQAKFSINATTGALTFATPPNYEVPTDADGNNVYLVTVQVSDGAGGTDTQAISVTVTDANDAPVITSNGAGATANVSVAENTTAVTTVTATDADVPAQTLSYSIVGGADQAKFSINSSTGALTFATPPNYESPTDADGNNVYLVTVQVSDGAGGTDTQAISVTVTDANDAPMITSNGAGATANVSVAENATAVTTVTATDADQPAQTLSYSIVGGADQAKFSMNATTGALTFATAPNYEVPTDADGNNVYLVTVQVSDGAGGTDTQAISVTVTDANDAPVITSNGAGATASVSVFENTTAVTTVTATDADQPAQTLSYSIVGGADQAKFSINATTGALSFAAPPNFESPTDADGNNVYLVTVEVSDGAGGTDTQAISVTVTDANDAPVITSNGAGATANVSVAENTAAVTTVTATDADQPAQTLSYSIVGGADQAKFSINATTGALTFATPPNFESPTDADADNVYLVTVQVSDGAGGTDTQAISVTVTDANDAPVITSNGAAATADVSVAENATAVTTVTATDADQPAQTLSYTIVGGADQAKFSINATTGALTFATPPNFESPTDADTDNVYLVTVQVSDGAGGTDTQAISVTVTDANDAPMITSNGAGATADVSVAENATAVTTVTATDADQPAQTLSYTIVGGADQAKFSINATTGALTFATPPNFESPTDADGNNVYLVTVQVSDGAGGTDTQAISVTVTDANDAPVITSNGAGATANVSVAENTTSVTTVTATDADQPAQTLSYSIVGGADQAKFSINATTGALTFATPANFESPTDADVDNVYLVTVQVSDGNGGTDTQAISVTVTDANDAPVITSNGAGATANVSVAENTTAVTTVTATDADQPAQTLSYSIVGGADQAKFSINATTGALTFATVPNFESPTDTNADNVYLVTVQVSDGAGGTDTQAISVTVTDTNDAPVITSNGGGATAAVAVVSNTTAVTTVTATDADVPAQTLTFSIVGGADQAKFGIDANTGALSFLAAPLFVNPTDADGDNVYEVTVQVSDGAGGTDTQAINAIVTASAAPVIVSDGGGATADVDVADDTAFVTTVTATTVAVDPDDLVYSIVGGADQAKFTIDADTGALSFVTAADYEIPTDANGDNVYLVTVQVDDGIGGTDTQTISVTVTDANDAPEITSNGGGATASISVAENATAVTTVTATDEDAPAQTLSYAIVGGADQARFAINATTGALSFVTAPNFESPADADADNVYLVTVQVSDGNGGTDTQAITVTVTDVNDAPVITSNGAGATASVSVGENTAAVTTVTATDADQPAQSLSYSIVGGADQAKFSINATTGVLTFATAPNFEAPTDADGDNVYVVSVQVSDGNGGTDTQAISVTVADANDAPVITSNGAGATASVSVAENSAAVTTVTATDADAPAQSLSYSIVGGADQAKFSINATTGALTFATAPNFEAPTDADADNVYLVTVQVSDGAGGTDTQAISVTVTDANDAPVITSNGAGATANVSVAENATAVTTVTATDADQPGQSLSYTIVGGADQAKFSINATTGVLTFATAPNFEAPTDADGDNVYVVSVQVSDGNGGTDTQAISVTVTDANDAPVITSNGAGATASVSVAENSTAVTTVTATDADAPAQSLSYSIVGGADQAKFSINATTGALSFATGPNFEAPTDADGDNVYLVTVQVSDGAGGTDTQAISVTVTDANDAPVIASNGAGATANVSVAENGTAVTTVTATDADQPGQSLSYTIVGGADQAKFSINATTGALTFAIAPNFEAPTDADADNVYLVTVQVSDGAGGTDTQAISVTVTDANDAPVITSNGAGATASVSVAENATAVTTVTATDADVPAQTLSYTIVGGADQAKFSINATTGALTFATAPNFEAPTDADGDSVYLVTVQVSDGAGGTDTQAISVTVTDANDAPVITSNGAGATASVSVAENSTAVTTVTATDADQPAQSLSYTIVGGADQAKFSINATTGVLTFATAPNFEAPTDADADNVYLVTVQVSDGAGGTDTQAISVTVTDANDAPVITSNGAGATASVSVAENATAVTTVTATDADVPAQTLSYTIVGGADQAKFSINATSGALTFASAPNFEAPTDADADNVYLVTVQVSDGAGGTDTQAISVTVTDANDAPVITSNGAGATANVSVAENATAVTTVTATDADQPAQSLSYTIVGGADQAKFSINATTGALTFAIAPNFEAPTDADADNVYLVTVQVSDGAGGTDTQAISVTVTDANDAPVITSNGAGATASVSVAENATAVTTVTATDADVPAQTLSYTIVGGADQAKFSINATTGALTFATAPNFEAPTDADGDSVYLVTVQVSDGAGGTDTQAISVTVTDANDAPSITSNGAGATASVSVAENATAVTTVTASDADAPAQSLSYTIVGGADQVKFSINATTGALTFASAPNFEAPTDADADNVYLVTVQVSDGNGGTDTQAISVTVTDANDAPAITSNGAGATASVSVAENATAVTTVTATDADQPAQTLSYSIAGGADQARFTINATTGALSFTTPPNFEVPSDADGDNVYLVTVQVSDGAGGTDTQAISVTVTDANDAPVITSNGAGSTASVSVAENATAVTTVTATDADQPAQTLSYMIVGGADQAKFSINATTGILTFATAPNFEVPTDADGNNVYLVTVQVSDGAGGTDTQAISVTVTDVNDAPVITSNGAGATTSVSVAENTASVTTVTAADADQPAQSLTYAIAGGADQARFSINATTGALSFTTAPNFEAPADADGNNVYLVTVQVSDGNGGTDTQAISVTVTDANDAPMIASNGAGATANVSVAENTAAVTTVTATDADAPAQSLSYSIAGGADQAKFSINATTGILTFATAPNFEVPTDADGNNVYLVTVQVSDGNGGTDTQAISVTVTDANDAPVITSNGAGASASVTVAESTSAVTAVTATDADAPAQTLSYTIVGGADQAKFSIDAATGALRFVTAPSFESPTDAGGDNVYLVTVQVSDGNGGTDTQAISVTVADANDAPVITSGGGGATADVAAAENQTAVTTITAIDADAPAQALTYAIVGGADRARFAIDAATGDVTFAAPPNFETPTDANGDNVYELTVQVSDGAGGTDTQAIRVTVTDANDAPVIAGPGAAGRAEVTVADQTTAVTTIVATDADASAQALSFAIVGGADRARFTVDATTGVLSFVAPPRHSQHGDADGNNLYEVVVQVSDGHGGVATLSVGVVVDGEDDVPTQTATEFVIKVTPPPAEPAAVVAIASAQPSLASAPAPGVARSEPAAKSDADTAPPAAAEERLGAIVQVDPTGPGPALLVVRTSTSVEAGNPLPAVAPSTAPAALTAGTQATPATPGTEGALVQLPDIEGGERAQEARSSDFGRSDAAGRYVTLQVQLRQALDRVSESLLAADAAGPARGLTTRQVATGSAVVVSSGFLAWLVRGSSLATGLISSVPLWWQVDPMAILSLKESARKARTEAMRAAKQAEDRQHRGLGRLLD